MSGDSSPGQLFLFDNASVTAGTFISVGLQSGGQLSINNSTVTLNTTTSGMNVGVDAGSAGNVELNNNALLSISTFLSIGQDGQGTLGIYSGSVVNVGPQSSPDPRRAPAMISASVSATISMASDKFTSMAMIWS